VCPGLYGPHQGVATALSASAAQPRSTTPQALLALKPETPGSLAPNTSAIIAELPAGSAGWALARRRDVARFLTPKADMITRGALLLFTPDCSLALAPYCSWLLPGGSSCMDIWTSVHVKVAATQGGRNG
jgi:hypothetical protein